MEGVLGGRGEGLMNPPTERRPNSMRNLINVNCQNQAMALTPLNERTRDVTPVRHSSSSFSVCRLLPRISCSASAAATTVARPRVAFVEFFRSIHTDSVLLHRHLQRLSSKSHSPWGTENKFFAGPPDFSLGYVMKDFSWGDSAFCRHFSI